jgi:hypothetical protein
MTVDVVSAGGSPRRRPRILRGSAPAPRYRLEVLAAGIDDVVRSAGGWLTDRALAGWDIDVLLTEPALDGADIRPLEVLGATARSLEAALACDDRPESAAAVAVAADLFTADLRVRDRVQRAYDRNIAEVTVWGPRIPTELSARFHPVEHVLTAAARVFKSHALDATAFAGDPVAATESFRSGALRGVRDDLIPTAEAYSSGALWHDRAGER